MDMGKRRCLMNAAKTGDGAAMGALADYLEECDKSRDLVAGLRFCVKYNRFPRKWHSVSNMVGGYGYWKWNPMRVFRSGTVRAETQTDSIPSCFYDEGIEYPCFSSPIAAITRLGERIRAFQRMAREIV